MNWRGFCPVCKRSVTEDNAPPSEHTPLLNNQEAPRELSPSGQASLMSGEASMHSVNATNSRTYNRNGAYGTYLRCNNIVSAPIRILGVSRHMSFQSLFGRNSRRRDVRDPMDAFRASPYFNPPSFFHNSAPNVLLQMDTSSSNSPGDSRHGANDAHAFMYITGDQFNTGFSGRV